MRPIHVTVTWQSEHLVEVDDEADLEGLMQVLGGQSNVTLVGYTAQPLDEAVDAAVDRLLGPAAPPAALEPAANRARGPFGATWFRRIPFRLALIGFKERAQLESPGA